MIYELAREPNSIYGQLENANETQDRNKPGWELVFIGSIMDATEESETRLNLRKIGQGG